MNFALRISNYISRYAPSEKKLFAYLEKKKFQGDITNLLEEIGYSESLMLDMWLRTFLSLSRGQSEIMRRLTLKWFPKKMIQEKLEETMEEIRDWGNHKNSISSQIENLSRKGKSNQVIMLTLVRKYPYFRDEIMSLMEEIDESAWLEKEIKRYLSKYDISDPKEKMKFFQALARKGFSYRKVENIIKGG